MVQASLEEVLEARELRVLAQQRLLAAWHKPVICFTLNIAGPVKVDAWTEYAFREGKERIFSALASMGIPVAGREELFSPAGRALLLAVEGADKAVKNLCVRLEEGDALGRLFDMDVLDVQGEKLSRPRERRCLVCGKEGRGCASRRLHPLEEIQEKTRSIIRSHWLEAEAENAAQCAVQSLLDEVCATPKPGLVDRMNCGSHQDMDVFTFCASAAALSPYFRRCFLAGVSDRELPNSLAFAHLQALGLEAERRMLRSTNGVNTHKGAIYSLGLLCASVGRGFPESPEGKRPDAGMVLSLCAALARGRDNPDTGDTNGSRIKARYGIGGVREEATAGFPAVRDIALPVLRRAQEEGLSLNDQCVAVLLHLIAGVQDTNMIARGGPEKAAKARASAQELLQECFLPAPEAVQALDRAFIQDNLSPGGCADLLAAALFLDRQTKSTESLNQPPAAERQFFQLPSALDG